MFALRLCPRDDGRPAVKDAFLPLFFSEYCQLAITDVLQVVVPGFEYLDHEFLSHETFDALMIKDGSDGLRLLLREEQEKP